MDSPKNAEIKTQGPNREHILEVNKSNDDLSLLFCLKQDAEKYGKWGGALRSVGFYVGLSYRLARFFYRKKLGWLGFPLQAATVAFTHCNISRKAIIGPGFALPHPTAIFIAPHVTIGRDSRFGPRVFIGSLYHHDDPADCPVLSSGVTMAAGATLLGGITIGEGVMVSSNEVVLKNVPDFHNVMSSPPRAFLRTVDGWAKKATARE